MRDRAMALVAVVFSVWVIVASDANLLVIAVVIMLTSIPLYPFFKGRLRVHAADVTALETVHRA